MKKHRLVSLTSINWVLGSEKNMKFENALVHFDLFEHAKNSKQQTQTVRRRKVKVNPSKETCET